MRLPRATTITNKGSKIRPMLPSRFALRQLMKPGKQSLNDYSKATPSGGGSLIGNVGDIMTEGASGGPQVIPGLNETS